MNTVFIILIAIAVVGGLLVSVAGIGPRIKGEVTHKCPYRNYLCPYFDPEEGKITTPCEKCPGSFKYVTKYDSKLVALGVKKQFDTNLAAYFEKESGEMMAFCFSEMERVDSFSEFMKSVFLWNDTPEGTEFWLNISRS